MLGLSRLLLGDETAADGLRYGKPSHAPLHGQASVAPGTPKSAEERRPIVVWNTTRSCNLKCMHCYTDSEGKKYPGELTTAQGKALIDDLAGFGIPALLLSGGEPLVREDFWELATYARGKGLRLTLSTNGTLIDKENARKLKDHGFTYVGISLDGIGETNDHFRGKKGAFDAAVKGFRNCLEIGQRVGLRLTLTRHNYQDLDGIFDFIEKEGVQRACFYHLVYSGRGQGITSEDLTHLETRKALDKIMERTRELSAKGNPKEILTVDNHVDNAYLYLTLQKQDPARAEEVGQMLRWNGGGRNSSGVGIADIDFLGNVHADQFWMYHSFGNVKERPFSKIWTDQSDPLMQGLKNQSQEKIKGKCSICKFYSLCGGALRVRADRIFGTPWAPDPACYLTNEECGISEAQVAELRAKGEWFDPPEALTQTTMTPPKTAAAR